MSQGDEEYKRRLRKEAYQTGYAACQNGLKATDNPFEPDDAWGRFEAWLNGFWDANWDD